MIVCRAWLVSSAYLVLPQAVERQRIDPHQLDHLLEQPRLGHDLAAWQFDRSYEGDACELEWEANRRIIDRVNPGYGG